MLTRHAEAPIQRESRSPSLDSLDKRILKLVAEGDSYDEAAGRLHVARSGIDAAMARMRQGLNALTDEHAVALAIRSGLID